MINQVPTKVENSKLKMRIIMLSPLGVVPIVHLTAILFKPILDVWTWVPVQLVYWVMIAAIIGLGIGKETAVNWLKKPHGKWWWSVLPFPFVLLSVPMFLLNWQKLGSLQILLPWILLGLINPFLEEGYWRGLMMDCRGKLPAWLVIIYAGVLFSLNHLALAVTSIACRNPVFLANTFILGILYGIVYYKTHSLRILIIAHGLMDLLGISVLCFLNIYIPPSFG
jgi:uncharacterized protein